jgi:hypothetical protein
MSDGGFTEGLCCLYFHLIIDITLTCRFEVLHAGVEGPCLHRPENWLLRQLIDEPKLVYEVGFIREKGKATVVQWSQEIGSSLLR